LRTLPLRVEVEVEVEVQILVMDNAIYSPQQLHPLMCEWQI